MTKISSFSDSENIRIYINDILHLRLPRDKNIKLQSWITNSSKLFYIEIWCVNHSDKIEYEDKEIWISVLKELDSII
jgi:hypothetical protein